MRTEHPPGAREGVLTGTQLAKIARFGPPRKPGFLKHNEALVAIDRA
jgi:hypothetical protein